MIIMNKDTLFLAMKIEIPLLFVLYFVSLMEIMLVEMPNHTVTLNKFWLVKNKQIYIIDGHFLFLKKAVSVSYKP